MSQFGYPELRTAQQVNHVCGTVQAAHCVGRIVVAMVEAGAVALEGAHQPVGRTAAVVEPAGEGTQVLHLLGRVFHDEDAGHAALRLGVEGVDVDAVHFRHGVDFVGNGIPAQRTFGLGQLARLAQHVLHQEVGHVEAAHAVTVVVDVAPAAAISHALVGDVVVHGQELLPQLVAQRVVLGVQIGSGDALHQVEIIAHLHAQLGEHVLVPAGYHAFVGLGLAHHEDGQTAHLAVLVGNLIEVIRLADGLHLLVGQLAGRVEHVAEAGFHPLDVGLLPVVERRQGDFGLPEGVLVDDEPVVRRALVDERHLHVGRLLAGIHLAGRDDVVEAELAPDIGGHDAHFVHAFFGHALHVAFVAHPRGTPAREVDAEGEGGAELAVLQEFKTNLLVLCLLVVHPHDEGRQIGIFARRVLGLEHQVFLHAEHGTRPILPAEAVEAVFVVLVVDGQAGTVVRRHVGRHGSLFKGEQALVLHDLCLCQRGQKKSQKRSRAAGPFVEMRHILLVYLRLLQCRLHSVTKKRHSRQTDRQNRTKQ